MSTFSECPSLPVCLLLLYFLFFFPVLVSRELLKFLLSGSSLSIHLYLIELVVPVYYALSAYWACCQWGALGIHRISIWRQASKPSPPPQNIKSGIGGVVGTSNQRVLCTPLSRFHHCLVDLDVLGRSRMVFMAPCHKGTPYLT